MTAKVTWGHVVQIARNGYTKPGRLILVGGPSWSDNLTGGFAGYNGPPGGTTEYQADSDAATDAMLRWLAQKPSAALNLLVVVVGGTTSSFGTHFQAGLTRLGHTYTLTESATTWTGFEPLDYDVVCTPDLLSSFSYQGQGTSAQKFDWVLSHNGAVLAEAALTSNFDRYGFLVSGTHSFHSPWQRPFSCAPIGGSTYKLATASTRVILTTTNTKGGTSDVYFCDTHATEGVIGLWSE